MEKRSMQITKNDWTSHVAAIKTQEGSTAAYARQHGLSRSALYYWQRKLKALAPAHTQAESVAPPTPQTPQTPTSTPVPLALTMLPKSPGKFFALRVSPSERVASPLLTTTPPTPTPPMPCTLVLRGGLRLKMAVLPDPRWLADVDHCTQGAQ